MNDQQRSAMKMALEALEEAHTVIEHKQDVRKREEAITALREALAEQAEQEPVAWIKLNEDGVYIEDVTGFPVYAAPVQQVDLTDDEIERALDAAKVPELPDGYKSVDLEIARAVIAADREKNK